MKEWLLVDGYNVINNWSSFRKIREENLEHAREILQGMISEYAAFKGYQSIIVFDAQEVQGGGSQEKLNDVEIIFTGEGETADSWIERRTYELTKQKYKVFVVTSDYAEQINILGSGGYRISAREFQEEYLLAKKHIAERSEKMMRNIMRNELGERLQAHVLDRFEELRRK